MTVKTDAPTLVRCPTCSAQFETDPSAKAETTYLRCASCGDVWNPGRHVAAQRNQAAQPRYFRLGPTSR